MFARKASVYLSALLDEVNALSGVTHMYFGLAAIGLNSIRLIFRSRTSFPAAGHAAFGATPRACRSVWPPASQPASERVVNRSCPLIVERSEIRCRLDVTWEKLDINFNGRVLLNMFPRCSSQFLRGRSQSQQKGVRCGNGGGCGRRSKILDSRCGCSFRRVVRANVAAVVERQKRRSENSAR